MPLLINPHITIVDSAGVPYGLAKLYLYEAGTLTPITPYTTPAFTVALSNPVIADANGVFPAININPASLPSEDIRIIAKTSADVLIFDEPDVPIVESVFQDISADTVTTSGRISSGSFIDGTYLSLSSSNPRVILTDSSRGTDLKTFDINLSGGDLKIRSRTDADGAGKDAFRVTRGSTTAIASVEIGNVTDNPSILFNGVQFPVTGSFTATYSGFTTTVTGGVVYIKMGSLVLMTLYGATGTSNTTAMAMSGIPSTLLPSSGTDISKYVTVIVEDNTVFAQGLAQVSSSGITFGVGVATTLGAFTNSGTKGFRQGTVIIYDMQSMPPP